jgi:hypothetical protein
MIFTAGATVSFTVGGEYVTLREALLSFPAASFALTTIIFSPARSVNEETDQLLVPTALPLPPLAFAHVTRVTPTLSEAVPERVIRPFFVE